jgi:hypothetical protein
MIQGYILMRAWGSPPFAGIKPPHAGISIIQKKSRNKSTPGDFRVPGKPLNISKVQ